MSREPEMPRVISGTTSAFRLSGQCDCDCDCACSLSTELESYDRHHLFRPLYTGPYLSRRSNSHTLSLGNNSVVLYGPHHTPTVLNRPALTLLSHFDQPRDPVNIPGDWHKAWGDALIRSTLEQMVTLGLLVLEGHTAPAPIKVPSTLAAWLHITDRCNLRCAYCYLPHDRVDMSAETGRAAIEATFRSALTHGYRQVKLKYAGGEPLLRFPLITELHHYAGNLSDRYSLDLDGVVLSNGTLLATEMVETMQSLDLRLMISLDGLSEFHDCQRHFAGGQGSFNAVARAVDLALSHGLVPDISITVSGCSADGLPELMAWVLERDLPFSLNFYRENGFSAYYADLRLEEERIIAGMLAAYKIIEANLPRRSLLASLADRANLSASHLRTCGVGHNYLVFDHLGRVAKCQMDMGCTVTDINDPDPLTTVRESVTGIRNLEVDEKSECRDCLWRYWCAGGCPLMVYRVTGRYDAKSPNCNTYKALFPEVLKLEGLRLLKYAGEEE